MGEAENTTDNELNKTSSEQTAGQAPAESDIRPSGPGSKGPISDTPRSSVLEVTVDHSIEKAMKILKRKLIKEGLFKELKMRRYFEKPSERCKRKQKESLKKARKEASRMKKNPFL